MVPLRLATETWLKYLQGYIYICICMYVYKYLYMYLYLYIFTFVSDSVLKFLTNRTQRSAQARFASTT